MQLDAYCMDCLVRRQAKLAHAQNDPQNADRFMRDVLRLLLDAPAGVAAPYMIPLFDEAFAKYWHDDDRYAQIKRDSNRFMLEKLPEMRQLIASAPDPLLMALKFAQTGNYIDFGALGDGVQQDVLEEMIQKTPENPIDAVEYAHFTEDLAAAKTLLYIGDNAGEIVADVALVEQLQRQFPNLRITFAVRGGPVLNDVTREDAAAVGMDRLVPIVDNGSRISGTELSVLDGEMRRALEAADVVLAKGQANFETMATSGYNTYFVFLCKCERFTKMLGVPMLTGMFVNDRRLKLDGAAS